MNTSPLDTFNKHQYVIKLGVDNFFGSTPKAERIARKYGMELEDLYQSAATVVWELALKHNGTESNFYKYAQSSIRYKMLNVTKENISVIKFPRKDAQELHKNTTINWIEQEIDEGITLLDVLSSPTNTERYVINKISLEERLNKLKPDQRKVIKLLLKGMTEKEIVKELGITRQYVSMLKKRALDKLKAL